MYTFYLPLKEPGYPPPPSTMPSREISHTLLLRHSENCRDLHLVSGVWCTSPGSNRDLVLSVKSLVFLIIGILFFFLIFIYFWDVCVSRGGAEREGIPSKLHAVSTERRMQSSNSGTMVSWSELKSKIGCLTHWATWECSFLKHKYLPRPHQVSHIYYITLNSINHWIIYYMKIMGTAN